ncbi:putative anaphase promoting complex subunit protein [Erysiphe neolycopersici]|uniref:Putative anaphase promoting complex subunit protein n=1 Tax=Erysiphe neolycopersici TaxID=212602 RepID=A0A420HMG8_9PEZI|nr:putative anaphase promoting complex subunit protein [Erysiphe neolycopersici]
MSGFEVPSKNLSFKSIDQSSNDAAHSITISPLPLLDIPSRPRSSQRIHPDLENTNHHINLGLQIATQLDDSMNGSNSNTSIIVDRPSEELKGMIDISNNPSNELEEQSLVERPLFAPFFTLIKTGESTAHPRQVHYLFSDDDANEVLTSTILQSLFEENSSNTSLINSVDSKGKLVPAISSKLARTITPTKLNRDLRTKNIDDEFADKGNNSKFEKRVVIVDLNSNGDGVASVNSLSSKWQVLNAQIEKAPTWNSADDPKTEETSITVGNLMLKIEGIASTDLTTHISLPTETNGTALGVGVMKGVGNPGEIKQVPGEEEMRNILESFDLKMDILRRVMGTRSRLDSQDTVVENRS